METRYHYYYIWLTHQSFTTRTCIIFLYLASVLLFSPVLKFQYKSNPSDQVILDIILMRNIFNFLSRPNQFCSSYNITPWDLQKWMFVDIASSRPGPTLIRYLWEYKWEMWVIKVMGLQLRFYCIATSDQPLKFQYFKSL